MSKNLTIYQSRTNEELLDALQTLLNALWGRRHNGHVWTIPCDELRDVDCILVDGITELELLRQRSTTFHALTSERVERLLMRYFNVEIALVGGSGPETSIKRAELAENIASMLEIADLMEGEAR